MSEAYIDLRLTETQAAQLAPLIREQSRRHKNVLFIASIAPDPPNPWRLECVTISATRAHKVLRVIRQACALPLAPVPAPTQERKTRQALFHTP